MPAINLFFNTFLTTVLILTISIMVEAGIDKEGVPVEKPKAVDGCRGFCDDLEGYFCLDFFGICEPCSQAHCESRDKSFCPSKCEGQFSNHFITVLFTS